jgi:hypothetical protein
MGHHPSMQGLLCGFQEGLSLHLCFLSCSWLPDVEWEPVSSQWSSRMSCSRRCNRFQVDLGLFSGSYAQTVFLEHALCCPSLVTLHKQLSDLDLLLLSPFLYVPGWAKLAFPPVLRKQEGQMALRSLLTISPVSYSSISQLNALYYFS